MRRRVPALRHGPGLHLHHRRQLGRVPGRVLRRGERQEGCQRLSRREYYNLIDRGSDDRRALIYLPIVAE
ncbi:MAG: hypothetical protein R2838_00590 [Caldilineaceae bacterium]